MTKEDAEKIEHEKREDLKKAGKEILEAVRTMLYDLDRGQGSYEAAGTMLAVWQLAANARANWSSCRNTVTVDWSAVKIPGYTVTP